MGAAKDGDGGVTMRKLLGVVFLSLITVIACVGDGNSDGPTPADCYSLRAANELDSIVLSMCKLCPEPMSQEWCQDYQELYMDGLALWNAWCKDSLLKPTMTPDLAEDCDSVDNVYGPWALDCDDPVMAGRVLEWSFRYCDGDDTSDDLTPDDLTSATPEAIPTEHATQATLLLE